MKRLLFLLLITSFSSLIAQDVDLKAVDRYLNNARMKHGIPGLAVAIVKDDSVIFAEGYGFQNVRTASAVSPQSLFGIASCTKAFTAAAIGMLVDEGKLNWDDRVIDYLPWFELHDPYVTQELRVIDLLCHRSGLGTFDGDLLWYGTDYSMEEVVRRIKHLPLDHGPRYQFGYQNIMYITAGLLIERITGESWQRFISKRLLEPLRMNHSTTGTDKIVGALAADRAFPHIDGEVFPEIDYSNAAPTGGINSSVMDLSHWLRFWLNEGVYEGDTLISPATYRKLIQPHTLINPGFLESQGNAHYKAYGLGWFLYDYAGTQVIEHGGGLPGYLSKVVWLPEEELGFVILTNGMTSLYEAVKLYLLDQLTGQEEQDWAATFQNYESQSAKAQEEAQKAFEAARVPDTQPSHDLSAYVGTYTDPMYGDAEISLKEGVLYFSLLPTKALFSGNLEHWHYDSFRIRLKDPFLPPGLLIFETDGKGEISGFKIDLPNNDLHFSNLHFLR
ncbi:MAG: serine hydrolase [Bacteroidota bacterium]